MTWNPLVEPDRRLQSKNKRARTPGSAVSHVVVHITGTADFAAAKARFLDPAQKASAHYVIDKDGSLYQFVEEEDAAWHAGIPSAMAARYRQGDWRRYLRSFAWYKGYPADAVFVDAALQPVGRAASVLVQQKSGGDWPDYGYFDTRWPQRGDPIGFEIGTDPNQYSIGIECVSFGARTASATVYPEAMYGTLKALVADICSRRGIPRSRERIVGHEDVDPVSRFGWDPNLGFDWDRVLAP